MEQNRRLFETKDIWKMKMSIQTLVEELQAVVFEKNELEYKQGSKVKTLLQLLANQSSNSDLQTKNHHAYERRKPPEVESHQLANWLKKEADKAEEKWSWKSRLITLSGFSRPSEVHCTWKKSIPSQKNLQKGDGFRLRHRRKNIVSSKWETRSSKSRRVHVTHKSGISC